MFKKQMTINKLQSFKYYLNIALGISQTNFEYIFHGHILMTTKLTAEHTTYVPCHFMQIIKNDWYSTKSMNETQYEFIRCCWAVQEQDGGANKRKWWIGKRVQSTPYQFMDRVEEKKKNRHTGVRLRHRVAWAEQGILSVFPFDIKAKRMVNKSENGKGNRCAKKPVSLILKCKMLTRNIWTKAEQIIKKEIQSQTDLHP